VAYIAIAQSYIKLHFTASPMQALSPDPILQILAGHMTAKYLFVASELGVFEGLANGYQALPALADQIHVPTRPLRILLDALEATGFLEATNGTYQNTSLTATFLTGHTPMDLRPILRLWDKVVYPQWATLEEALRDNKRTYGLTEFSQVEHQIFNQGVATLTAPSAKALAHQYDFTAHRSILDLAGGMGVFLTSILEGYTELKGTLFELAATAAVAKKRLATSSIAERIQVVEGDLLKDDLPTNHDAVILANVIHLFSPETNLLLLRRIRQSVPAGGRLLLVDFWTDSTHTQPKFAALMAAEFHIFSGQGDVYSREEVNSWLELTGWQLLEHQPLTGAASLIIALAI